MANLPVSAIPDLRGPTTSEAVAVAPKQQSVQRIRFVIEIPFQRADLPAIALVLLAITLIGWWVWMGSSLGVQPTAASTVTQLEPLAVSFLQQPTITLLLTLAIALIILAAAVATSPLRWWAYARFGARTGIAAQFQQFGQFRQRTQEEEDAEAWVAAQEVWLQEQQAATEQALVNPTTEEPHETVTNTAAEDQSIHPTDEATTTAATIDSTDAATDETAPSPTEAATTPGKPQEQPPLSPETESPKDEPTKSTTPESEQPQSSLPVEQPSNSQPTTEEPPAQPEATEKSTNSTATQPKPAEPNTQQPSEELAALLDETDNESLDLDDLQDVQDLLSSFADNDTISPELLALSQSLDDVHVTTLAEHIDDVAQQLMQSQPSLLTPDE